MYMNSSLRKSAASLFGNFKKRKYLRIFGLSSELFRNLWKKNVQVIFAIFERVQ